MFGRYIRIIRTSLVLAAACVAPLSAAQVSWVDWVKGTVGSSGNAQGTIRVGDTAVDVAYSGEIAFLQTSGGCNYWNPSAPYIGSEVDNAPPPVDIIALSQTTTKSLSFSRPVSGLCFALMSLNANAYTFDHDFRIVSTGNGYWGDGTLTREVVGDGTYRLVGADEPHGVIIFDGPISSLTWVSRKNEYWNGFTVGAFAVVPEPCSMVSLGLGLMGLVTLRPRPKKPA